MLALAAGAATLPVAAGTGAAAPWKAVSTHKHLGSVDAVLSFEKRKSTFGAFQFRKLRLVVKNNRRTVFDRELCTPDRCGYGSHHVLSLENVWGSGTAEAMIDLYTGGAHCCFQSLIVLVDGSRPGRLVFHNWGDPGFEVSRHDGAFDFLTADDRFAYAFTSFAGSGLPLQVLAIGPHGLFQDVTSSRLDLVGRDVKRWWQAYVSQRGKPDGDIRGVLAAWCADEYRLGQGQACGTELAHALKAGYLRGPTIWPAGARFVRALRSSLERWGYATR